MDYKKIFMGLLSTALKLDEGQIAELIDETGEDVNEDSILAKVLAVDTARVNKLAPKKGMTYQDGYSKALAETMTKFEKELRETYGLTSETKGLDLVAEILSQQTTDTPATEDAVKKHPAYINMQREFKRQLDAAKAEGTSAVEAVKTQFAKEKAGVVIRDRGLKHLSGLNPNLPEDKEIAEFQLAAFFDAIHKAYDFDLQGEDIIVNTKEGQVATDAHGHNVEYNDVIADYGLKFFGAKKNNGGNAPGNKNDSRQSAPPKKGYPAGVQRPTTFDAAVAMSRDPKFTLDERRAILDQWEADNPGK
jgi:hypothetical protein